jgi:hypothetical protein
MWLVYEVREYRKIIHVEEYLVRVCICKKFDMLFTSTPVVGNLIVMLELKCMGDDTIWLLELLKD